VDQWAVALQFLVTEIGAQGQSLWLAEDEGVWCLAAALGHLAPHSTGNAPGAAVAWRVGRWTAAQTDRSLGAGALGQPRVGVRGPFVKSAVRSCL
jgi:hypothetical protein